MNIENTINLDSKTISMMFELQEIESAEEIGLVNTVDITVTGNETFTLANGCVSHNSASGGLMPALGRKNFGYYELKGKPLNAYNSTQQQFQKNEELSLLYNIIKTEGYKYIVAATDQDLDGFSIRGLLIGFMEKYLKSDILQAKKFGILKTPIRGKIYKNKMIDWVYEIEDNNLTEKGESKYFKGIGTWKPEWLKQVIEKDGISKMIDILEYDENAEQTIDEWLDSGNVERRKEKLRNNEFDLIKL